MYSFCIPGSLLRRFGTGCEALGVHRATPDFAPTFGFGFTFDTRRDWMLAVVCFKACQRIPIRRIFDTGICRIFDRLYLCHYIKNTKRCHRFPCRDTKCNGRESEAEKKKANVVWLSPPARLVQHLVSCNKKM